MLLHAIGFTSWIGWTGRAEACSCVFVADLVWPQAGATTVSTQPDIVVARSSNVPMEVILEDPNGGRIPLIERPVEPLIVPVLCLSELSFLTTASALTANTTYSLRFRALESNPLEDRLPPPRSFTTAEESAPDGGIPQLDIRTYKLSFDRPCDPSTFDLCGDYVEVELAGGALDAPLPFWLRLTSSSGGSETTTLIGQPLGKDTAQISRASLPIDAKQPCISYERFDARGQTVASGQLCKPDKCALAGDVARPWRAGCGSSAELGADAWKLVGGDSCSAPPLISRRDGGDEFVVEVSDAGADAASMAEPAPAPRADATPSGPPADDSGAADRAADSAAPETEVNQGSPGGCTLATRHLPYTPSFPWLLALVLLARQRRVLQKLR
jgi:hypothetical protein